MLKKFTNEKDLFTGKYPRDRDRNRSRRTVFSTPSYFYPFDLTVVSEIFTDFISEFESRWLSVIRLLTTDRRDAKTGVLIDWKGEKGEVMF